MVIMKKDKEILIKIRTLIETIYDYELYSDTFNHDYLCTLMVVYLENLVEKYNPAIKSHEIKAVNDYWHKIYGSLQDYEFGFGEELMLTRLEDFVYQLTKSEYVKAVDN